MAIIAQVKNFASRMYKVVPSTEACISHGRRFIQKLIKETTTDVGSFTVATNVIKDVEAKALCGFDKEARMVLEYLFPGDHDQDEYVSPLPDEVIQDNVCQRHITVNAMYDALENAGKAKLTIKNMVLICKDWEAFARAGQEGILDAIKNGWVVRFLLLKKLETITQLSRKRKATRKWTDREGNLCVTHDFNIEARFGADNNVAELQAEGYDLIDAEDGQATLCVATTKGKTAMKYDKKGKVSGMDVDDLLHHLMDEGMNVMQSYGVELINLRPEKAGTIVEEAEKMYASSPVFRHAVHQLEGCVNEYRTLVHQRLAALDRIDEKDAQQRASVSTMYRDGFNEVSNVCRGLATVEGLDLMEMELASFYVSSHGVSKEKGWHAYTLMEMSSFAHSICEEEFALFWMLRLKESGYAVPEWTEDRLSEGSDLEEDSVVDFVLGEPVELQKKARKAISAAKAELRAAEASNDADAVKEAQRKVNDAMHAHFHGHCDSGITGRYVIRKSHGHLVASKPLFEEKEVDDDKEKMQPVMQLPAFDPTHWCWISSHTQETSDGIDAFIDAIKDRECYVVDSLKAGSNYCHVVLVKQDDGTFKVVSRFRPFGFDKDGASDDHRDGIKGYSKEESNLYRKQTKKVNTLIGVSDTGKKCLKGTVYSVLAGKQSDDKMVNAVVLMKDCEKVEITDAMRAAAFEGNVQQLDDNGYVQMPQYDLESLFGPGALYQENEGKKEGDKPMTASTMELSADMFEQGEDTSAPEPERESDTFGDSLDEAMGVGEDFSDCF